MIDNFFGEQTERSQIKVEIVTKYFPAWAKVIIGVQKRFNKGNKIGYIDLYAGRGQYGDGTPSTPVRIIEQAIATPDVRERLVSIFNDKDEETVNALKVTLEALPGYDTLTYQPQFFVGEVDESYAEKMQQTRMIPTFSFVDPFGYKGVTQRLLRGMLKDFGCDLLFFFSYMGVNRGISNPMVVRHMDAMFGVERANALSEHFKLSVGSGARELVVLEELINAMKDMGGQYVLPFRFRDDGDSRTTHHLIFVSKDVRGYSIMKEIMGKESSKKEQGVPLFEFCAADKSTPTLFELCRPLDDLEELLLKDCAGKTIGVKNLAETHGVGRNYLLRNYKDVLRKMELEGKITADPPQTERPMRKGEVTFADHVQVTFPPT